MHRKARVLITGATGVIALGVTAVMLFANLTAGQPVATRSSAIRSPAALPSASAEGYVAPSTALIAALPEAKYDAVIPGLIAYTAASASGEATAAYTFSVDTALYAADRAAPVARFAAINFLGEKNVVVPVAFTEGWALVLTPARQALPSEAHGHAPAQTAGWVRIDTLTKDHPLTHRIVISVKDQSLTILDANGTKTVSFSVGVGAAATPTPTGVTGYIQARYLDPAQGQRTYPIQLTSLHSAAADEPYGGNDGGLIGVHYFLTRSGAISHGCIRLSVEAITAVNLLPTGTLISITN